jgi:hypothetical protein
MAIECGRLATWKIDQWPLRQVVDSVATPRIGVQQALYTVAQLVATAYLELVIPEDRRKVLVAILEALGRRGDFRGVAVDAFGQMLVNAFGLNAWVAQDAIKTFEAWRRGRAIL